MSKFTKVIFDAMLLIVLLGMLIIPVGSFGMMSVNIPNQTVLSTQDIRKEPTIEVKNTNTRQVTEPMNDVVTETTESDEMEQLEQ
ncbi:hypothetical protein A2415_04100 [candidate division WWE3 bacterium RIFOXYC1_FULL_39_7]|uniref:Uncharacterized protein n=2 Tax=Katanobacteria TaxID=422282 RepID=A0A1F4X7E4_UNCKA|nr:MAG: hypothetical protein A2415_04100 [candidate division WWE3 bacterium RIFOXYC1_FULL_39_7]OGC77635.1 MAG: hypothetical protein A2619_05350 [candidate division WWE3 bacterium RIFOXYD1_FULL_39_9]